MQPGCPFQGHRAVTQPHAGCPLSPCSLKFPLRPYSKLGALLHQFGVVTFFYWMSAGIIIPSSDSSLPKADVCVRSVRCLAGTWLSRHVPSWQMEEAWQQGIAQYKWEAVLLSWQQVHAGHRAGRIQHNLPRRKVTSGEEQIQKFPQPPLPVQCKGDWRWSKALLLCVCIIGRVKPRCENGDSGTLQQSA